MKTSKAQIIREDGPFPGIKDVAGVTFAGQNVWFASNDKMNVLDPESGEIVRTIDVAAHAGTAFDGKHLWQIAEDLTRKVQVWAKLPPVSRTTLADGKTLVEPVGIRDTKDVAAIAQMASQMAFAAIAQALPDAHVDIDTHTATAEQIREAIGRIEAAIGVAQTPPRIARTG